MKKIRPLKIYLGDLTYTTVTLATEAFPLNVGFIGSYCKKLFGNDNQSFFKMYLPVKEDIFLKKSKIYLNKIIRHQLQNKKLDNIVLDQALNMLNFIDPSLILISEESRLAI